MNRLWLAIKLFFKTLFDRDFSKRAERLLLPAPEAPTPAAEAPKAAPSKPTPKRPVRSEALTLLETLQREARLIDFLKEPLDGFSDQQIGAVARDIHRDCGAAIERMFHLAPLSEQGEDSTIELPPGFDAARYRLTGNVSGEPPFRGRVTHHGWKATTCVLPTWSGDASAATIVAPIEVEIG
jgi:hypothetical protein